MPRRSVDAYQRLIASFLATSAERITAMSELVRVAKPGAVIYVSVMGYLAVLRTVLIRFSDELLDFSFQTLIKKGDTIGSTGSIWHFFRADELRELAESCGLTTIEMAGCEGLSTGLKEATNLVAQDEAKWKRWVNLALETSAEPAVVDMAEVVYVSKLLSEANISCMLAERQSESSAL